MFDNIRNDYLLGSGSIGVEPNTGWEALLKEIKDCLYTGSLEYYQRLDNGSCMRREVHVQL